MHLEQILFHSICQLEKSKTWLINVVRRRFKFEIQYCMLVLTINHSIFSCVLFIYISLQLVIRLCSLVVLNFLHILLFIVLILHNVFLSPPFFILLWYRLLLKQVITNNKLFLLVGWPMGFWLLSMLFNAGHFFLSSFTLCPCWCFLC